MKKKIFLISIPVFILLALVLIKLRAANKESLNLSPPITRGTIVESVYGIGTVNATKSFNLKIGVSSTIRKIFVNEGDSVKKNGKLMDLDGTIFYAPIDGTVTFLPVKIGESVFAQSVLLTLVDLTDRYLVVSLEQRGVIRVAHQQKVRISFENMRDRFFEGSVESVYSNESNFLVRIRTQDLPPQILPGMTADVGISVAEKTNALLIPAASINSGQVRFRRKGKDQETKVKIGLVDGAVAEVLESSLQEGDQVYLPKKGAK